MEIGVDKGWGAERMIKATGANTTEYYGFDFFNSISMFDILTTLKKLGVSKVRLYQGNSLKTLPETVPCLPKMDLIYIDGGKDETEKDFESILPLLHFRSVVIVDDYKDIRVKRFIDNLREFDIQFLKSRRFWFFHLPTKTVKVIIKPVL